MEKQLRSLDLGADHYMHGIGVASVWRCLCCFPKLREFACIHLDSYKTDAAGGGLFAVTGVTPIDLDPARGFECVCK